MWLSKSRMFMTLSQNYAGIIQNHEKENVAINIGQGEARHRKYKILMICCTTPGLTAALYVLYILGISAHNLVNM
jgi:hypothetical protein